MKQAKPATDRRQFLKLMGMGAMAGSLNATIAKALQIPPAFRTGTIRDVEHIVVLMQENNSFDEYFGMLRGVRGFADPRVAKQQNGNSLWLQPGMDLNSPYSPLHTSDSTNLLQFQLGSQFAGGTASGYPATQFGGVTSDLVVPPLRLNPAAPGLVPQYQIVNGAPVLTGVTVSAGAALAATPSDTTGAPVTTLGLTYRFDLDHGWGQTHAAWNAGQWDQWVNNKNPLTMSYLTREDIPFHYALADAFTVGDNYFCSIMSSTNPNRLHLWTGCIGNMDPYINADGTLKDAGGVDGFGSGPRTGNGLSGGHPLIWKTYPEMLTAGGISWKIYQDLAGETFGGNVGSGSTPSEFVGTFSDNPVLYFSQTRTAAASSPLFQGAVVAGATNISGTSDALAATATLPADLSQANVDAWSAWADHLFDKLRADVEGDTLPQVSWIVPPAGYSEHPGYPTNYGAWYVGKVLEILVSNPKVFAKTAFIINYDENDGYFDHLVAPTPPVSTDGSDGASTVSIAYEIIRTTTPVGPVGLGIRVPLLVISPWSKGGYVSSELFDHTSVIQFIEKRFGVHCPNISPWRRAVTGDLTSCFNFAGPNSGSTVTVPDYSGYLPSVAELGSKAGTSIFPLIAPVGDYTTLGLPQQETGVRPARALPYQLYVEPGITPDSTAITLTFRNAGRATAVFQVRSGVKGEGVRNYTVEPGKSLKGTWAVPTTGLPVYDLSVYGPNGFFRSFKGSLDAFAAFVGLSNAYGQDGFGSISLNVTNQCRKGPPGRPGRGSDALDLTVFDAYTGQYVPVKFQQHGQGFSRGWQRDAFHGWYDFILTASDDPTFEYRLAGHIETGRDSYSDPAMGGLVTLKTPS